MPDSGANINSQQIYPNFKIVRGARSKTGDYHVAINCAFGNWVSADESLLDYDLSRWMIWGMTPA
jgi:hypothetical protein